MTTPKNAVRPRPHLRPLACAVLLGLVAAPAFAAEQGADDQSAADQERHRTPQELDKIEVRGFVLPTTADAMSRPVEVLAGERLDEAKASSLGETVGKLPGVQSSYFGPGVGRPIVRGFDGARVQVVSDGLGSGDVSTVSADHAVSIEPFLADQIEVLKGPATLLYGSGAIGGAVNVVDGRIPDRLTDEPLQGRAELRAGTVNDERTGMVRVDASTESFVLHADALHRETGDVETPLGTLAGTALRTDSAALGGSWIGPRGFFGAGASLFSTLYGIPGTEDEGGVRIDMDQRRTELRAGIDDLGPFTSARLKVANTEYEHVEFEGNEIGTRFNNDATEARLELVHKPLGAWNGAFGVQWGDRDFAAVGEEAFVPSTRTRDAGVFYIGNRTFGESWRLELGARADRNKIDADATAIGPDRNFSTASASASLRWNATEDVHVDFGVDRAQRAPTAEELYSNGVHVATQSIELGNPTLDAETANRAELGVHWHTGPVELSLALYHVRFDDFIYLADTGALGEEDLPVRQWSQGDARFNGGEAELTWHIAENASGNWDWRLYGDLVRATLNNGGGDLPRMVPARFGSEFRWERDGWRASLNALHVDDQDRVAAFETPTPGYTLVGAHVAWHMDTSAGNAWEFFLDGTNLLDKEARVHTSFLKDVAPLAGRGFAFGVRTFF